MIEYVSNEPPHISFDNYHRNVLEEVVEFDKDAVHIPLRTYMATSQRWNALDRYKSRKR